jgi:hypothetical protein
MLNIRLGIVQFQTPQAKDMQLFNVHDFEISAPQSPTHYSPAGTGNVLDIVVYTRISDSHMSLSLTSCTQIPYQ